MSSEQPATDPQRKAGFDFDQTDVRDAVRTVMKVAGLNYSISPEVEGKVTGAFHNMTCRSVLNELCKRTNANYRIEDGLYEIGGYPGFSRDPWPSLSAKFEHVPIRKALAKAFEGTGKKVVIDKNVSGYASCDFQNIPFDSAVRMIAESASAFVDIRGTNYRVHRRTPADLSMHWLTGMTPIYDKSNMPISTIEDKDNLFIVRWPYLYKVRKSDLALVSKSPIGVDIWMSR